MVAVQVGVDLLFVRAAAAFRNDFRKRPLSQFFCDFENGAHTPPG